MKCNPTVNDVYEYINSIAPFEKQCEWDNSGFIVGDKNAVISKIGVVLDITNDAVKYASENRIDLIVSHHPVIFRGIKTVTADDPTYMLIKNGISAICAHTSLDIAKGGVNDALADALGFKKAISLSDCGETEMVRVAEINGISGEELAKLCADKLSTSVSVADSGKIDNYLSALDVISSSHSVKEVVDSNDSSAELSSENCNILENNRL